MLLRLAILTLCTALCLGCSTVVKVVNFSDKEFYTEKKGETTYYCMSDYYLQQVLEAKIKQVNPK